MTIEVTLIGGQTIAIQSEGTGSELVDLLNNADHPRRRGDYVYVQREDGDRIWVNVRAIGWVSER